MERLRRGSPSKKPLTRTALAHARAHTHTHSDAAPARCSPQSSVSGPVFSARDWRRHTRTLRRRADTVLATEQRERACLQRPRLAPAPLGTDTARAGAASHRARRWQHTSLQSARPDSSSPSQHAAPISAAQRRPSRRSAATVFSSSQILSRAGARSWPRRPPANGAGRSPDGGRASRPAADAGVSICGRRAPERDREAGRRGQRLACHRQTAAPRRHWPAESSRNLQNDVETHQRRMVKLAKLAQVAKRLQERKFLPYEWNCYDESNAVNGLINFFLDKSTRLKTLGNASSKST